MWTKLRITPPGKMKLWKFYSGKKDSIEAQVGNHEEQSKKNKK